jgi:hypothetical protein
MLPRYAVLFKTYTWNAFNARQLERICAQAPGGDVWVLVDNTSGRVPEIPHDRVFRVTEQETVELGLMNASTDRSLFWYNPDYLHYAFFNVHGDYDYYLTIEDDACAQTDLDRLAQDLASRQIDLLGSRVKQPTAWPWTGFHRLIYSADELQLALLCFAGYSRRAMALLFERRREMTAAFKAREIPFWPISEGFIPTEVARAGYRTAWLEEYGSTEDYDWWGPTPEADLPAKADKTFLHPVLEGERYLRSILKHDRNLLSYLDANSPLRRTLAPFPPTVANRAFRQELRARTARYLQRRMERLGLRQHWAAGAFLDGKVLEHTPPS